MSTFMLYLICHCKDRKKKEYQCLEGGSYLATLLQPNLSLCVLCLRGWMWREENGSNLHHYLHPKVLGQAHCCRQLLIKVSMVNIWCTVVLPKI